MQRMDQLMFPTPPGREDSRWWMEILTTLICAMIGAYFTYALMNASVVRSLQLSRDQYELLKWLTLVNGLGVGTVLGTISARPLLRQLPSYMRWEHYESRLKEVRAEYVEQIREEWFPVEQVETTHLLPCEDSSAKLSIQEGRYVIVTFSLQGNLQTAILPEEHANLPPNTCEISHVQFPNLWVNWRTDKHGPPVALRFSPGRTANWR